MKNLVKIVCWHASHITELSLNRTQEEKLDKLSQSLKRVCPQCKPANNHIVILQGQTIFNPNKAFKCKNNHLSLIGCIGDKLQIKFGPGDDDFYNIDCSINDLDKTKILCHNCNTVLKPIDDFILTQTNIPNIKTKVRVGDLWDKNKIEPVRNGTYTQDGYNVSKTQQANRQRIANMKRDRVNKPKGDSIPSTKRYHYKTKDSIDLT